MKISYAMQLINPGHKVDLSGYGYYLDRVTDQVQEDIAVYALLLRDENEQVLIVNCDLLGLSAYVVNRAKKRIAEQIGIDRDRIIFLCTHTHTAPTVIPLIGCGELDYEYQDFLIRKLETVARQAAGQAHQVMNIRRLCYQAEPVGYNRTILNGPEDHSVYGLEFRAEGCAPYLLLNYSCHPVTLGPAKLISSDYPHYVLQNLHAHGYEGMFINGCNGDIDPICNRVKWGSGTKADLEQYGHQLTNGLWEALDRAEALEITPIEVYECSVTLPVKQLELTQLPMLSTKMKELTRTDVGSEQAVDAWEARICELYLHGLETAGSQITVRGIVIGSSVLLALPGELYTELGQRVRKSLPSYFLLIGSNADIAARYVPSQEEAEAETYGGLFSSVADGVLPLAEGAMERYVNAVTDCFMKRGQKND